MDSTYSYLSCWHCNIAQRKGLDAHMQHFHNESRNFCSRNSISPPNINHSLCPEFLRATSIHMCLLLYHMSIKHFNDHKSSTLIFVNQNWQGSNDYPDEDMPGAVRKSHQPTPMLKKSFPDNTTCRDDDPAIGETLVDPSAQPSQTDAIGSFDDETSVSKKVPISKKARHTWELHKWRFSA